MGNEKGAGRMPSLKIIRMSENKPAQELQGMRYSDCNSSDNYDVLSVSERKNMGAWIHARLKPVKTTSGRLNSYGLKYLMERETGLYVTMVLLKGACQKPETKHMIPTLLTGHIVSEL